MGSRECGATGTRVPRCCEHNAPSNRRRILCLLHKLKLVIKRKPMIDHEHTTLHHKVLNLAMPRYLNTSRLADSDRAKCFGPLRAQPKRAEGVYRPISSKFAYQKGISIGSRLAVVYNRKDYLCSMETAEVDSRARLRDRRSPDVHRFMTNLLVYAMKYGGNTNRTNYQSLSSVTAVVALYGPHFRPIHLSKTVDVINRTSPS